MGLSDGTMDSWCNEYGPMMEAGGGVGWIEGLWLRPSDSSLGDLGVGLNHLPALNADVGGLGVNDSWSAFGFVFADTANTYEPATGLEEGYTSTILWVESY